MKLSISFKKPEIIFLTFMGAGLSPYAPGTIGSIAILLPLYFLGQMNPPFFFFLPLLIVLIIASTAIISYTQKKYDMHDPKWIVIDEVIGMWIASFFLQSNSMLHYLLIFGWFRVFDIFKPWPINYFDRMTTASSVIIDDILAAVYAGFTYLGSIYLFQLFS